MVFQLCPPSVVSCTYWLPTYTRLWSKGEMASGIVQSHRYFTSRGAQPSSTSGHTLTSRAWPSCMSMRLITPS